MLLAGSVFSLVTITISLTPIFIAAVLRSIIRPVSAFRPFSITSSFTFFIFITFVSRAFVKVLSFTKESAIWPLFTSVAFI